LAELGSDKSRIISANVFIANIHDKPVRDEVWNEWIGSNPENWPQRACLGVDLGGNWLIEITVTALRDEALG
jgi:enamine deaminase RidA (YjgF/YER057c/UK114 family)